MGKIPVYGGLHGGIGLSWRGISIGQEGEFL